MSSLQAVRSIEGDTVDKICYRYLGATAEITEQVLDANPQLAAIYLYIAKRYASTSSCAGGRADTAKLYSTMGLMMSEPISATSATSAVVTASVLTLVPGLNLQS